MNPTRIDRLKRPQDSSQFNVDAPDAFLKMEFVHYSRGRVDASDADDGAMRRGCDATRLRGCGAAGRRGGGASLIQQKLTGA